MTDLRAPFPYFGGKSRVAAEVWAGLGDVDNYVEPFAGSLAVLLGRPEWHRGRTETVNDSDQFLSNFWRALAADSAGVAAHADWPVNEADLFARHLWLVNTGLERLAAMGDDPEWFDVKIAGWWVWGLCAWIGAGWCSGTGPHKHSDSGNAGRGVKRQMPHLTTAGLGVNRQIPHLSADRDRPWADSVWSAGVPTTRTIDLHGYLTGLAERLRAVRVCCGDWSRVVGTGALIYGMVTGVFLDPPYLGEVRMNNLYAADDHVIAHDVREWALEHGDDPTLRIVLAGYDTEHDHLIPETWRRHRYSAVQGYARASMDDLDANRHKEVLWFSPHCVTTTGTLFDLDEETT